MRRTDKVLKDTPQVVVRSLWDVNRGHLTSGILMEGRYRIEDVRDRTRVRSDAFENLLAAFREANITLAQPSLDITR